MNGTCKDCRYRLEGGYFADAPFVCKKTEEIDPVSGIAQYEDCRKIYKYCTSYEPRLSMWQRIKIKLKGGQE